MRKQIEKVHNYFKGKIVLCDYEIIFMSEYRIKIRVDDYFFSIWIGGGISQLSTYSDSFMVLDFSEKEKELIYANLLPLHKNYLLEKAEMELGKLRNYTN